MSSKMLQATWIVSNNSNTNVSSSTDVKDMQKRLQVEVGLPLKVFDDVTEYIIELGYSSPITEKRILILEANVANEKLHALHHLCQVVYIFVYWMNFEESLIDSLKQFESTYKKVRVHNGLCFHLGSFVLRVHKKIAALTYH